MVDPITTITTATKAINAAINSAKELHEIYKKIEDADALNLMADLNLSLADSKMALANIQEENLRLKEELKKSQEVAEFRSKL